MTASCDTSWLDRPRIDAHGITDEFFDTVANRVGLTGDEHFGVDGTRHEG